jgi:hypothetical protein
MKRVAIVLVTLLVVPLFAGSAAAAEKGIRRYLAETSDGQFLRFRTVREADGRRLDGVFFGDSRDTGADGFHLTCDDGTTEPWGGAGFSEWPWFFEGRTVTVELTPEGLGTDALHMQGTFRPDSASGTFRYTQVFLNEDETVRLCSTGELTWTADRVN